jgi:hypothetical protein
MRSALTCGVVAICGLLLMAANAPDETCTLTVRLVDAETGRTIPGLIRIADAAGRFVDLPALLSRASGLSVDTTRGNWSVLTAAATFPVPRNKLRIEAISGLETELAAREIDLTGQPRAEVSVPLTRFYSTAERGFRSANTHLHLMKLTREQSDRYLAEVPQADGLDALFVSYLERAEADRDYITNRYTKADLEAIRRRSGIAMGNGEEHRHNFTAQGQGYGHVMLLDINQLVQPVSIGPGITKEGTDGLPIQRGIDAARRDGATVIWCHNNWGMERLANMFTGRLHAQNIFDGGTHGSYKESFYPCLNAGLRVPFSTGTDWFMYDFSRVYVPVSGPLTVKAWLQALAAGRSFITNGPLLEFQVSGQGIGETVNLAKPQAVRIAARAIGRVDFKRLELVQNGRVIRTEPSRTVGGHFESGLSFSLEIDAPCWLAVRVPPPPVKDDPELQDAVPLNELGQPLFAHTSPIYIELSGRGTFDRAIAESILAEIQTNAKKIEQNGLFADAMEKARVLDVYADAAEAMKRHIAQQ